MKRELCVNLSYRNEIPILSLEGQITSMQQHKIFEAYKEIPEEQIGKVVIDFQKTDYINSSGIAVLIQLIKDGKPRKGGFAFANLNPHLYRVFDAVGFTDIIPVHNTVQEAAQP